MSSKDHKPAVKKPKKPQPKVIEERNPIFDLIKKAIGKKSPGKFLPRRPDPAPYLKLQSKRK
jgi:hypothetical protein